ncbi:MAG: transcriptional initiation protein Tat [Gammaproteobacteria bacterium]|mgnify:FL=1
MNNKFPLPPEFLAGLESLSRRRFLLGGARLAAVAGATLALPGEVLAADKGLPAGIKHMSLVEYRVLDKIRVIMLPTEKFGLPSSTEIPVMQNVDILMSKLDARPRILVRLAINSIEYGGVFWRFSRFSAMSNERALKRVQDWQTGNMIERGFVSSLKMMVSFGYWQDHRTYPGLEYDGPVTEKWGIRRLGNAPLPR